MANRGTPELIGGGKEYSPTPEFFGPSGESVGKFMKVGDGVLIGTGYNVPDHSDQPANELTFPGPGSDNPVF